MKKILLLLIALNMSLSLTAFKINIDYFGYTHVLDVDENDSIVSVKRKLFNQMGYAPVGLNTVNLQQIDINAHPLTVTILNDDKKVSDYDIKAGAQLFMSDKNKWKGL